MSGGRSGQGVPNGTGMRCYDRLDTSGLVATGAWKSHTAAHIYEMLKPARRPKSPIYCQCQQRDDLAELQGVKNAG